MMPQLLNLAQIRTDGGTQCRVGMDPDVIQEYATARLNGARFPPIIVFYDGDYYWLADGFYRVASARKAKLKRIEAHVRNGTKRDAILFAVGANQSHGLRRTNADKRRAVLTLLQDPEWAVWSNLEISRRCGVSHDLVHNVRVSLHPQEIGDEKSPRLARRGDQSYLQQPPPGPVPTEEITVRLPLLASRFLEALLPSYQTQADVILDALKDLAHKRGVKVQ